MGLFKNLRKRRIERKAAFKAAQTRAKVDAKEAAKLEKEKEKYLRKTAKQVRKMDAKELKKRRKHEEEMAKASVEQLKAGRFNARNVLRFIGAARVAAPVVVPLVYRVLTQLQGKGGVTSQPRAGASQLQSFPADGAPQRARMKQTRKSVDSGVPSGFAKDVNDRMDVLTDAIDNAGSMGEDQRKRVLESVSKELDLVEAQIDTKRA